ncbi:MAG: hypothetical protein K5770_19600 [Lachnospiraceae bacterium]|nr:hypothetical protein [Lachnospiraceae bacterium]
MRKMKRIMAALVAGAVLITGSFSETYACRVMAAEKEQDSPSAEEELLGPLPVKWDLTELYADEDAFNADMDYLSEHASYMEKYRGTLDNAEAVLALTEDEEILKLKSIHNRAEMYTEFLRSLDASDPWAKQAMARFEDAGSAFKMAEAFIEPEIMALPLSEREKIFSDERLKPYAYHYHIYVDPDRVPLSEELKRAETLYDQAADQAMNAYLVFDTVENKVPEITYPDGTTGALTDAAYSNIVNSSEYDHAFRREANMLRGTRREPYLNTYAELLAGEMKRNWAEAQIHGYDSTLEYIADKDDVDPQLFYQIIEFSHSLLPEFHEYLAAKKELLGLEEMGSYDIYVPFNDYEAPEMSYEDCVKLGREAVKFWGDEYLGQFDRIITSGHVDVYPSDTKEAGAYMELCGNETLPFVMFNFDGNMNYTSTIVHEMGHAVYGAFSEENQNFYSNSPGIFNHEVASTANELIFNKYLIDNASDEKEKKYWIANEITLFFNNVIWACVLAEFEDYCYKTIESGNGLSADVMNEKFYELLKNMYGEDLLVEPYLGGDWARMPHLYYGYYLYKYANSLTFATAICNKALEDDETKEAYLEYLKAGSSAAPGELLKIAGVDPSDPATFEEARAYFENLVDQFIE